MNRKKVDGIWYDTDADGVILGKSADQTDTPEKTPEELEAEAAAKKAEEEAAAAEAAKGGATGEDVEKAAKLVVEKIAQYQKLQEEVSAKKSRLQPGLRVEANFGADVKLFRTRKGVDVTMKESSIEMSAQWFKQFVLWKLRNNPDAFKKMQEVGAKMEAHAKALGMSVKLNAQDSATAADGGNLVPTILHNAIVPLVEDIAVVRPNATVLDMTGVKTLDIPTILGKPVMTINGEALQKGTSSMTFGKFTLTPYNLAAIVALTTDLVDYAPFDLVKLLTQSFAEATAKAEDKLFMTGSGSSQPTGIDNYTFAKTINAGGAISFKHLNQAYFGIPQVYRQKGFWIMDNETIVALSNMTDTTGQPILKDAINEDGFPTIKRRPVLENNDINNKIFFGDLKSYWIGASRGLQVDISKETTIRGVSLWERNMMAVRAEEKIDGEVADQRAFAEINNT